jgi:hypothetical protein
MGNIEVGTDAYAASDLSLKLQDPAKDPFKS